MYGIAAPEVDRRIAVINERGSRLEVERWNRILTSANPTFNTNPNDFLVRMAKGRTPGTALDVGMGQGRNAIYLAQQGWTVTAWCAWPPRSAEIRVDARGVAGRARAVSVSRYDA